MRSGCGLTKKGDNSIRIENVRIGYTVNVDIFGPLYFRTFVGILVPSFSCASGTSFYLSDDI